MTTIALVLALAVLKDKALLAGLAGVGVNAGFAGWVAVFAVLAVLGQVGAVWTLLHALVIV